MKKLILIFFILFSGCFKNDSFQLYGIPVLNSNLLSEQMKSNYRDASLPLPHQLQNLLSQIIIFENKGCDELSGYTETITKNGKWDSSIIYLSATHFQVETLLHEALHIYDEKNQISSLSSFQYMMKKEMNPKYHSRIYKYYDVKDYPSEYFVESMLSFLSDSKQFQIHQPLTYHYLVKVAVELKD